MFFHRGTDRISRVFPDKKSGKSDGGNAWDDGDHAAHVFTCHV